MAYQKGHSGYWLGKKRPSPSEETRKKRSLSMKGKNTWAKGRKQTAEERIRRSISQRGSKCYLWKGGLTKKHQAIRCSVEYKLWREAVFERDNYTCVWCGKRGGELNADHIKPFALFPELRFAIDNGRTLCRDCHITTETYGNKK